ncbi:MAG: ABC transporter ATP-binding protein [Candidatus Riflebacteria bacterium]|nr:ABC transporter ATP-binding protein [Candidatus Riflebacteria bacterium]
MIKFENLRKEYKSKKGEKILALDGFSLNIADNEVFALAGINGAGKTTVLKALFGLIKLDEGNISISLPDSKKPRMSFAPEIPDLPDYLSVEEVLALSCRLANEKPLPEIIEKAMTMFELVSLKNKIVSTLSKGNRQRLSLAASVVYNPDIIVFDEPTTGLDPLGRKLIKSAIKQLKSEGHTLLFSTHMLADLPDLCDRMAVIHKGKIVFSGLVSEFSKDLSLTALEDSFAKIVAQNGGL